MYSHKQQNVEFKVMYERKIEGGKKKNEGQRNVINRYVTYLIRKQNELNFLSFEWILPSIEFFKIFPLI